MDVWHMSGDGRGTGHPSTVLGYYDAPSIDGQMYQMMRWLNAGDTFGLNFTTSSIVFVDAQGTSDGLHGAWPCLRRP